MMKKDGKEIYTFVGLINRMESCRNRDYKFTEKDISEEVEFKNRIYKLDGEKKFYYDLDTGVTLAEIVGEQYGMDMFKYLTEHEFIVTPKEKVFLTSEEKEFLRMCNSILGSGDSKLHIIQRRQFGNDSFFLCLTFCRNDDTLAHEEHIKIGATSFSGLSNGTLYLVKDLGIYE